MVCIHIVPWRLKIRKLNAARSKTKPPDQPVSLYHCAPINRCTHYNGLIFPFLQTNITSHMWPRRGKGADKWGISKYENWKRQQNRSTNIAKKQTSATCSLPIMNIYMYINVRHNLFVMYGITHLITGCFRLLASILLKINALIGCSRESDDTKQFHAIEIAIAAVSPHRLPDRAR